MDRPSAAQRLKEAQNLALSAELLAFCDAQHAFVDDGADDSAVHQHAREGRRRRLEPQTLLMAMQIGGCYRSEQLYPGPNERHTRCAHALHLLLAAFFGSEARPAERRVGVRKPSGVANEKPVP